ncbi:MAG: trypsin-like peptidase domain-containing protein [Thermoleophilia bacterium]|nr:trypsin-like peptidase domain-containing protein [Thermoleophilia bacterium]
MTRPPTEPPYPGPPAPPPAAAQAPGPAPPAARRGPRRWLAASVVPAVIGASVAVAATTLTDLAGDDGSRTVTVVERASGALDGPGDTTAGTAAGDAEIDPPAVAAGAALPVSAIVRRLSPGVMLVTTGDGTSGSLGTGFLVDRDGHILTNAHVVANAKKVEVTFQDGESLSAAVLGSDPATDVAVLRIADVPAGAAVVPLGTIRDLAVGDPLVAIGNPLGYRQTVTTGIVSALKRTISSPDDTSIQNVIQTDAAINQGNSGGPLIDRSGRVVGINSQIATEGTGGGNLGIGFAVPIDTVRPVARSIIDTGKAQHAWIGIVGTTLDPRAARANGLTGRRGVMIVELDGRGPAKAAGLRGATSGTGGGDDEVPKGGDVIVGIDGRTVADMGDVSLAIAGRRVGAEVRMTVLRDGVERTVTIRLADRPADIR